MRIFKRIFRPIIWLFFYKRNSFFEKKFQKWLLELFLADSVDLRMFHHLNQLEIIPSSWEVKGLNRETHRAKLLDFDIGYFVVSKSDEQAFIDSLEKLISKNSKYWFISDKGYLNLIIFCLGLGFIIEEKQYKIADVIKNKLSDKKLNNIAIAFCNTLNEEVKNESGHTNLNSDDWQKLYTQSQYYELFGNPIEILSYLTFNTNIVIIDVLLVLSPKLRVAALNYLILPKNNFEKKNIVQIIEQGDKNEVSFLSLLFFSYRDEVPDWMDEDFFNLLLTKHWENILPYLINQTFGDNVIKIDNAPMLELRRRISLFLIGIQTSEKLGTVLKWPTDWISVSHWIESLHALNKQNELSKSLYCNMAKSYFENLDILIKNIFENDLSHKSVNSLTINDIGKSSSVLLYSYILLGYINMQKEEQKDLLNILTNILYLLKELLYGGYTSKHIALELIDRFLFLLLCSENLTDLSDNDKTVIKKIQEQIEKIVLYSYVKYRESEDLFWDKNYQPNYYSNLALYYLNERLKSENPIILSLKTKINGMSFSTWGK